MTIDRGFLAALANGKPDPDYVKRIAAVGFGVTVEDLESHDRTEPLVHYRQVAMYAVRTLSSASLPATGRQFDRDHTTVMHACQRVRKVPRLLRAYEALCAEVERQWAIDHGLAYGRSALVERTG